MKLTLGQLVTLAMNTGFPDPYLAAAVAFAESGGYTCAQGDPPGEFLCDVPNGKSTSFGLWQVNTYYNPKFDATRLLGAEYNARAALSISQGGRVWTPWSTYKSDAYKPYYRPGLQPEPLPLEYVRPPSTSPGGLLAATAGVLALAAAAGYGAYKARKALA